jgi:serine protease Do
VRSAAPDGAAQVASVETGSVAEQAGIKPGDIIQKFEGDPVPNFRELTEMIKPRRAGDEVTLEVLREGQTMEIKVKLGAWQTFE